MKKIMAILISILTIYSVSVSAGTDNPCDRNDRFLGTVDRLGDKVIIINPRLLIGKTQYLIGPSKFGKYDSYGDYQEYIDSDALNCICSSYGAGDYVGAGYDDLAEMTHGKVAIISKTGFDFLTTLEVATRWVVLDTLTCNIE